MHAAYNNSYLTNLIIISLNIINNFLNGKAINLSILF